MAGSSSVARDTGCCVSWWAPRVNRCHTCWAGSRERASWSDREVRCSSRHPSGCSSDLTARARISSSCRRWPKSRRPHRCNSATADRRTRDRLAGLIFSSRPRVCMSHLPPSPPALDADELQRYHRHLILPEIGADGQRRLKAARVLLIGAGGLGSPAALYLAAAGVGHLGIVDADEVGLSNLQRQVLHDSESIGTLKVESAQARLRAINPHVEVVAHHTRLTSANAMPLLADYDVIVDGSDNFPTRYLVNDACVLLGKPNVYGSVLRFDGQASVFSFGDGPCYRCLFREPPPPDLVQNCADSGVLGVLPGLIGVVQAAEAIKLITGAGEVLA